MSFPGVRLVNLAVVVSAEVESQPANNGAYRSRSRSGPPAPSAESGGNSEAGVRSLYLYFTGFCVNTPSGSSPLHETRSAGVKFCVRSSLGFGLVIWTVGAWVNEKNARATQGPGSPRSSTALITKMWKSRELKRGLSGSGWEERNCSRSSLFRVTIQAVSLPALSDGSTA